MNDKNVGAHTQGEWEINSIVDDNGNVSFKRNKDFGNQEYCAIVVKHSFKSIGFFYPTVDSENPKTNEENIANAKLIALAPALKTENEKLKEALEDALSMIRDFVSKEIKKDSEIINRIGVMNQALISTKV